MKSISHLICLAFTVLVTAQHVTVPTTCTAGFHAGVGQVIYNLPYTYNKVVPLVSNFKNLTYQGTPASKVKLNGTDDTVGTARTYHLDGATIIETELFYSDPAAPGPYVEVHNTALFAVPGTKVKLYIPYDGLTITETCGGKASMMNWTAHFCANNTALAKTLLDTVHRDNSKTVEKYLGGKQFTKCSAISSRGLEARDSLHVEARDSSASATSVYSAAFGAVIFAIAAFLM